jgi:DNA-binding FadR family transcriptional regulator
MITSRVRHTPAALGGRGRPDLPERLGDGAIAGVPRVPLEIREAMVAMKVMEAIIESWDDSPHQLKRREDRTDMPLTHPRRSGLCEQVIAALRAQIASGEWPVGARIPTEPELVEELGVARNTVREAVRALAHNGLLDIRQGSGTYVVATSELASVMQRRFADADLGHIAELRAALESSAAALAARRRTERDLKQLDALLARRDRAWDSGDAEAFVTADASFHRAVVAASHNDVMTALYADLGEVLRDWLRMDVGDVLAPETYMDHTGLVDTIRAGDAQAAATEAARYPLQCRPGHWRAPAAGSVTGDG